eukprot:scaffold89935_cov29-Tisochrysis_lutea.AAC.3
MQDRSVREWAFALYQALDVPHLQPLHLRPHPPRLACPSHSLSWQATACLSRFVERKAAGELNEHEANSYIARAIDRQAAAAGERSLALAAAHPVCGHSLAKAPKASAGCRGSVRGLPAP